MPEAKGSQTKSDDEGGSLARTVLPLLIAGGLLLAHVEVLAQGPAYAGPLLFVDHLFDLALAASGFLLLVAAGRWLLRRAGLVPEAALDLFLHSVAFGPGLFALLLLALGFAGILTPLGVTGAVIATAALARREILELPSLLRAATGELREALDGGWLLTLALGATALAAGFLVLHGSAPPGDWDSLTYHLEVPARWLAAGRVHVPDGNLHAAYAGLFQILYVPFLVLDSPASASLLQGIFAVVLGLATFRVGQRLFDAEVGLLSCALLWATTGFLLVAVTARVDTTLAFYLLLGHAGLVLAAVDPAEARGHVLRAAVVLGLGAGMKYHALAFTAALAPVGVWALQRMKGGTRARLRLLGLAAAVFAAVALPWMIKNAVLFGGPFYPFFAERIFPPWMAELYGSRVIPQELQGEVFGALGQAREPFDLVSLFVAPERLTVEPEGVHYHMNAFLLLLPLWVFHLRRREVAALAGPSLVYGLGVGLVLSNINLRYLFPALPALTVVTSFFAVAGLRRFLGARRRGPLLAILAAVALVPTLRSTYQWTRRAPVVGQAVGTVSRQDYLQSGFAFYAGLAGTVNGLVPEDGNVLLLWESRGFYLAPGHLQDNILANWPFLRVHLRRSGGCLEGSGITHVLASTAAARYYASRGSDQERLDVEGFQAFARRCLVPIDVGQAYGLYRVRGGSSLPSTGLRSSGSEAPS